jgi:Tol biopolymer transport system component
MRSMMWRTSYFTFFLLALLVFCGIPAMTSLAQSPTDDINLGNMVIPGEVLEIVGEEACVLLITYETKAQGGEAVAYIEALHELITPLLEIMGKYDVQIDLLDLDAIAKQLRAKLDNIQESESLAEAQSRTNDFIIAASKARMEITTKISADLRDVIEPALLDQREKIRADITAQLMAEGATLGEGAQQRLTAQANEEAGRAKEEIYDRLRAAIEAEMKAQYSGIPGVDAAVLMDIGYKIGMERGQQEAEKVLAEITAKYEALAEREKAHITRQMEQKAEVLAGDVQTDMDAIKDGFENLEADMIVLAAGKMDEWEQYYEKAAKQRRSIFEQVVNVKTDYAIEVIESYRALMEEAKTSGFMEQYDLPDTDALITRFTEDRDALIDRLAQAQSNEEIDVAVAEFQQAWNEVRSTLEVIGVSGSQDTIRIILERLAEQRVEERLNEASKEFERIINKLLPMQEKGELDEDGRAMLSRLSSAMPIIDEVMDIIDRLRTADSDMDIREVLALRDQLQTNLNYLDMVIKQGVWQKPTLDSKMWASKVTYHSARLNGSVLETGGQKPSVIIYWGTSDGRDDPSRWQNVVSLGKRASGIFRFDVSGLKPDTRYYFRCFAYNSIGGSWAEPSASFVTPIELNGIVTLVGHAERTFGINLMNADGTDIRNLVSFAAPGKNPQYRDTELSPNGDLVAFTAIEDHDSSKCQSLYLVEVTGGALRQLTDSECDVASFAWSPHGDKIAFYCRNTRTFYTVTVDSGTIRELMSDRYIISDGRQMDWSPDGRWLVIQASNHDLYKLDIRELEITRMPVYIIPVNSTEKQELLGGYFDVTWSPDGKYLAFISFNKIRIVDVATSLVVNCIDKNNINPPADIEVYHFAEPCWSADSTMIAATGRIIHTPNDYHWDSYTTIVYIKIADKTVYVPGIDRRIMGWDPSWWQEK